MLIINFPCVFESDGVLTVIYPSHSLADPNNKADQNFTEDERIILQS